MISHKLKCIQIHIPKTAGLCIRECLFQVPPDRYMHIKPNNPRYQKYINDYFTFTFIRNPYDRLVSGYLFTLQKGKEANLFNEHIKKNYKTFNDFILNVNKGMLLCTQRFEPQVRWVKEFNLDFIGRMENIQNDFNIVCEKLGIEQIQLCKNNVSNKKNKHYTEFYTEKTKKIVTNLYKEDLEYFNYKFGE